MPASLSENAFRQTAGRTLAALMAVLCSIGLLRAGLFATYATASAAAPWPTAHLEGASVHFAWRVQHSLELFPDDADFPFVANMMGPCGFWMVGGLGRLCDADVPTLYLIGRLVSLACGVATAVLVGGYLTRRYGLVAGIGGGVFALGAAPMIGYAVMTRPDMLADLAGVAGFFLACGTGWHVPERPGVARPKASGDGREEISDHALRSAQGRAARGSIVRLVFAAALLAVACLTKQTAAVYAIAAVVACAARGRGSLLREALPLAGLTTAFVLSTVGMLWLTSEPHIVASLLGQGDIPWAGEQRIAMLVYLLRKSPEIVWFSLMGGLLWTTERYRNRELLILALLLWLSALVTCGKRGSDLNYFLSLRIIAALAAGTLCAAALRAACIDCGRRIPSPINRGKDSPPTTAVSASHRSPHPTAVATPWLLGGMLALSAFMMLPSCLAMSCATRHALAKRAMWRDGDADVLFAERDRLATLAACGGATFLTDDDQLAVYQGGQAAIVDTYLFRLRVETGAIDVAPLVERLRAGAIQYLVLSADVTQDYPDTFFWRLPDAVANAVRRHYELSESSGPWFVYVPQQHKTQPEGDGSMFSAGGSR